MRRPTRTRRLSIAAVLSLLAFGVVAAAGARSFWVLDNLSLGAHQVIFVNRGCLVYDHESTDGNLSSPFIAQHGSVLIEERAFSVGKILSADWVHAGFWGGKGTDGFRYCERYFGMPLWPLLLLLLIAPARWLIARPVDAAAFPVVTDAKQP